MLDFLVDQRLEEAVSRGELDNLPGAGRPLEFDDDALVPEELRLAYRILKNAGYVPPEVQDLKELSQLERLVSEGNADARAARKLALLKTRIETAYYEKVLRRLR
jgi:hypothetical protein